jgi:TetR/AcrR family transcriptional regulator, mexJK operon transcriptional repressor
MTTQTVAHPRENVVANPKVQQIVEAARRLFMADGYGSTSMDAIARDAGVSKATLYSHFTNKAELFAAIIGGECQRFARLLWSQEAEAGDVRSVLLQVARAKVQFTSSPGPRAIYRIVVGESGRFPELGRVFYENGPRRVLERLADYLRQATERGVLNVPHPRVAAEQFFGMVHGADHLRRLLDLDDPKAPDVDRIIDSAVEVFLRAYGPADRTPSGRSDSLLPK